MKEFLTIETSILATLLDWASIYNNQCLYILMKSKLSLSAGLLGRFRLQTLQLGLNQQEASFNVKPILLK